MSRHLPQRPPGSQLPPELAEPDPGQGQGLQGASSQACGLSQRDLMSLEHFSLCGLPAPSPGPSAGSPGLSVPAPGATHHPRGIAPLTVVLPRGAWG